MILLAIVIPWDSSLNAASRIFDTKAAFAWQTPSNRSQRGHKGETLFPPRLTVGERSFRSFPSSISMPQANRRDVIRDVSSSDGARIFGCVIYSSAWTQDNQPMGMYSFDKTDGSTLSAEMLGESYIATGGGVYADGKYYFVSYMDFMGMYIATLYVCDFETWEIEANIPVSVGAVAQDMTYDPVTGNVYGCFMNDDADGWVFGRLSLETYERTVLRDLDMVFVTVAANSKGQVFGIGYDGVLYEFDKQTGVPTRIGSTGLSPRYSASGCFDLRTDKFYWECMEADVEANIYEVDTTDGSVRLVTTLPDSSEMYGMFIPVPEAEDDAPAAVSTLNVAFAGNSLSGAISFTMPNKTFVGAPLSGMLGYAVKVNEEVVSEGTAEAGTDVSLPVSVAKEGSYRISVTASNEVGNGSVSKIECWIGSDIPQEVPGLKLVKRQANELYLSWSAPASTVHGGYMDPSGIRYKIVRMPDNKTLADAWQQTEYTDVITQQESLVTYWYEVTAINDTQESYPAASNKVSVGVAETPFFESFDDEDGFALFDVVDANNDGETWIFDEITQAARIKYSAADNYTAPKDDWLFTPLMAMKADRLYKLAFKTRCYSPQYAERFEVKMGTEASVAAMTMDVLPVTNVTNNELQLTEKYVTVAADGNYTFGIHACSLADKFYLYVDDVLVEEGPLLGTPGSVSALAVTAGENGQYKATLSFKAPIKTVDDKALSEISKIDIYRDGELVTSLDSPAPGAPLSYEDNSAVQGINKYVVVACNAIGSGMESEASVFVGHDIPGMPTNVSAKEFEGKVNISWEAPTKGESNGYFDPAALTYTVIRANDEAIIAEDVTTLSAVDNNPPMGGYKQEFFAYYVFAKSPAGYGEGVISNLVIVGDAYELPFAESFPNALPTYDPWDVETPESSDARWKLVVEGEFPTASAQDGDDGLVSFVPQEEGDISTLYSGKISFKEATNPVLEFYYYFVGDSYDYVTVSVSADGGEFETVHLVNFRAESGEPGWRKVSVSLEKYIGAGYIQLAFEGESYDGTNNIHLDNIKVKNLYDYNLSLVSLAVPERLKVGEAAKVSATVENTGLIPASSYSVELYVNGKKLAEAEGEALNNDEVKEYVFDVNPTVHYGNEAEIYAKVVWAKDQDDSDNASDKSLVVVSLPRYPAVDDLAATEDDGAIVLTWSEPAPAVGSDGPETDGAESYKAFAIRNIGEWTVVDGDKSPTYGISDSTGNTLAFENAGSQMAFMVFNPQLAGIDLNSPENSMWLPYEGDQMFVSIAAENGQNDDWLISPELPGTSQEISFFVKSLIDTYGLERYEVLYSMTDASTASFIRIGSVREASVSWEEVKVALPEGTKYFAIHCVSPDVFAFMVDNVTFLPAAAIPEELSLIGYNVYRDGEKLNDEPVEELSYTDHVDAGSFHEYVVTVVYDKGESPLSNVVSVNKSGLTSVTTPGIGVSGGIGSILIRNAASRLATLFAVDGRIVGQTVVRSDSELVGVPESGIYVVKIDGLVVKVLVK